MGWQPYKEYVSQSRKQKSRRHRVKKPKDKHLRRGHGVRVVNAPKPLF